VTSVAARRRSDEGLEIEDPLAPRTALLPTLATDRGTVVGHAKAEARRAARALHEAVADVDAGTSEELRRQGHGDSITRTVDGRSTESATALVGRAVGVGRPDDDPTSSDSREPFGAAEDNRIADTLRTTAAGGVRWSLIATIAVLAGRLAFVVVLMRLLGPENYGIVAQATVYIVITGIFLKLGLAANIIQRPHLEKTDIGSAFWLNVLIGSLLAALTVLFAPGLASFFRNTELTAVLRVLSLSFVLKAFSVVPTALLTRRMELRSLGVAEVVSTFLSGTLGLVAALNGASYWALVIQTLALDAIYLVMILGTAGRPPLAWSRSAVRRLWSFSSRLIGADLINYVSDNTDKFLVARFLGATPLALYGLAGRILVVPVQTLGASADRVIFPMFSRLQHDRAKVARLFLDATESVALAVSPLMLLAVLSAPRVVPAIFGESWRPAVLPLQLLAVHAVFFILVLLTNSVVLAFGRTDWEFRWSIVTTTVAVITFAIGLHWGIVGVAASFLVLGALLDPIRYAMVGRLIPISVSGLLRVLAPALTSSVVLTGMWLLVATALDGSTGDLGVVAGASLAAIASYVAALRTLWPKDFQHQFAFARLVLSRSPK
jgi:O-antigen/teichoic acid export membrane protein